MKCKEEHQYWPVTTQTYSPACLCAEPVTFNLGYTLEHKRIQATPQTGSISISGGGTQAQACFKALQVISMSNQLGEPLL